MKKMTFKDFWEDMNLDERAGDIIYSYNGKNVVDTSHAIERRDSRRTISDDQFEVLFKRMIDMFQKIGDEKLHNEEYLVFSRSLKQGIIVAYRPDRFNGESDRNFYIMTVLPYKKQYAKPGTKKILVEGYAREYSDELVEFLSSHIDVETLDENIDYDTIPLWECVKIITCGKSLYDLSSSVLEID